MTEKIISVNNFSRTKIDEEKQPESNGSSEKGVVGALLADDLINLLALAVIEIECSVDTTCS